MPSFSIEAQGETVPLTADSVYTTLAQASGHSGVGAQIQAATKQLSNWEKTPGYYSILQDIYLRLNAHVDLRFQAIIQLKNGIDKHWRKTAVDPIGKEEKSKIRTRALEEVALFDPFPQPALQNALMIAKIVRYDFPHDWPDVIALLVGHLRKAQSLEEMEEYNHKKISNLLSLTLQIVKELASGKLQRTRKSLQSVSVELLQALGALYLLLVNTWTSTGNVDVGQDSYAALKAIRRLLIAGFEHPHREREVWALWRALEQHQSNLWNNRTTALFMGELIYKHLLQISKLHLEMARTHASAFVLLPQSIAILNRSWTIISLYGTECLGSIDASKGWEVKEAGEDHNQTPLEKLALKNLLLFRACVKMVFNPAQTFKYLHPQDKEDKKTSIDAIRSVLTDGVVVSIMETLVTQYFVLQPSDIHDWESEPDEWERREDEIADSWEYATRSCAEKLFLDLVINFKPLLVPRLLHVFQTYATVSNTRVFLKESLYSAIGIAAACLEDTLDFNTFLQNTLASEVQMKQPHYNILRRRTAILLGQWVPMKPDSLDRQLIYQIFAHLLSKSDELNDSVVRVTAGRQLRMILEPFEFSFDDFAPYADMLLHSLMDLIMGSELTETKMALLETVRKIVLKLEGRIAPYADGIMQTLPSIWAEADTAGEHLMKQAVLTMITAIVQSLKQRSIAYHSAVLPLIRNAVDPESEAFVYLLEEALELWTAIVQQTNEASVTPELLSLFGSLVPLLSMGSESSTQVLELIESYEILSTPTIIAAGLLPSMLSSPAFSVQTRRVSQATRVVDMMISILGSQLVAEDVRAASLRDLINAMLKSDYLRQVLDALRQAHAYHQRPSARPPDIVGPSETSLFNLLARLLLADPVLCVQTIQAASNSQNIEWLVSEWFSHFDSIGDILRKKLQLLAITNLLRAEPLLMLEQLQSLMSIWTDVLTELALDAEEAAQGDYLWNGARSSEDVIGTPEESPEDSRRRVLGNSDPLYCFNARKFVGGALQDVIRGVGSDVFHEQYLTRLDSAVLQAFAELRLL